MKANKSDGPIKLKIRYSTQPAVDTGGVSKQFFQNFFAQMQKTFNGINMFEGNDTRLIPTTNSHMKNSGLPTMLGRIFACGLSQGHFPVGPRFLSPAIYKYLASGNMAAARESVSLEDAPQRTKLVIQKVILHCFLTFFHLPFFVIGPRLQT